MKNHHLFIIIISLFLQTSNAQIEDYLTMPANVNPTNLALNGNDLFIATTIKIYKVDISESTPTLTDFTQNHQDIFFPGQIKISGNTLYIPQIFSLLSIDITQSNPTLNTIAQSDVLFFGQAINGNDIYIAYNGLGEIVKFDLSQSNPNPTDIITGLGNSSISLALNGNDLYIARLDENKISKIDITQTNPTITDVISGVSPTSLLFAGNDLYFSDSNSVKKIDVTQTNPTIITIAENLPDIVSGIEISNNYIYMSQEVDNKILRLNLNTLGVDDIENKKKITIYPNPTKSIINISNNNEKLKYKIINLIGEVLMSGIAINQININNLETGLYFLKFENNQTIKILKE